MLACYNIGLLVLTFHAKIITCSIYWGGIPRCSEYFSLCLSRRRASVLLKAVGCTDERKTINKYNLPPMHVSKPPVVNI